MADPICACGNRKSAKADGCRECYDRRRARDKSKQCIVCGGPWICGHGRPKTCPRCREKRRNQRRGRRCPTCGVPVTERATGCRKHNASNNARPVGSRYTNAGGYVLVKISSDPHEWRYEHWVVMEKSVGRRLFPDEEVHHRNGVRSDNRLGNLELWTRSHPRGQRVEDKLAWAKEFVERYGELPATFVRDT
jgi:hypothetical protein